MNLKQVKIWAAAALVVVISASAGAADPVRVPGTRASIQPPQGFSPASRFPGFERADLQSSIMVTEIPASAADMMRGMSKERLAAKGMSLISSKSEKIGGRDALLVHVAQSAAGTDFLKWMLVTGDQDVSLLVVGTYPKSAEEKVGTAIRSAVLTASWAPAGWTDPFAGLPFRVTSTSKLKVAGRVSNMLILTESGRMGPSGPGQALYIVGSSVSETRIQDLRQFSEARAKQTAHLKDIRNFEGRPLPLGELAGYELLADARDEKSGAATRLYQVIAPDAGGYMIVQGLVAADRAAEMLPEFRKVTASFRKAGP